MCDAVTSIGILVTIDWLRWVEEEKKNKKNVGVASKKSGAARTRVQEPNQGK
jgi:hypothetical protein